MTGKETGFSVNCYSSILKLTSLPVLLQLHMDIVRVIKSIISKSSDYLYVAFHNTWNHPEPCGMSILFLDLKAVKENCFFYDLLTALKLRL